MSCALVMAVDGKNTADGVNASGGESGETEEHRGRHISHPKVF